VLDESDAHELFDRACRLGDAVGCLQLGWWYEHAEPKTRDMKRAGALYLQACDAGEPTGCSNLGWMYDEGLLDGEKRPQVAMTLYDRACSEGSPAGCNNLAGHLLDDGNSLGRSNYGSAPVRMTTDLPA